MKTAASYSHMQSDSGFKIYHELMLHRVWEVLLVSSPYDAFILEEDGSLASRIIHEYQGLNLSKPPRLTSVSTGQAALELLRNKEFDLVITTPYVGDMDAYSLGCEIKRSKPSLPVILLTANPRYDEPLRQESYQGIDNFYLWSGSSDLFLAIIKNLEDHCNVSHDTKMAMVRVLILVEDSPAFRSTILPILYKIIVKQTQTVLDESLNEEHRLLKMRARPKILVASSYEEALNIFNDYKEYVFGIVSDTRFFLGDKLEGDAGIRLLSYARQKAPDMPLLLLSSNPTNRSRGEAIPAVFQDKNDPELLEKIELFFLNNLGFGDFVFRMPDGREVDRAENFHAFERVLAQLPDDSLRYHAENNHFSAWIMARSEIGLATVINKMKFSDFAHIDDAREYLIKSINELRRSRQKGVVVSFTSKDFDSEIMDFVKIGKGSMGGKARGLAYINSILHQHPELFDSFTNVSIKIPKTVVLLEDAYNSFIENNKLYYLCGGTDRIITKRFLEAELPLWLKEDLRAFLNQVDYPLAVRSSSLLEDAHFRPYAGLYKTCMLPNNHPDFEVRLQQLEKAIKLVYASSYFEGPRSYSRSISQTKKDSMAVMIQQVAGQAYGSYFYPALSGVAQSYNYYPISYMKPEDGIAHIALGFGKTVVEGETSLRFSPKYPQVIPQFADIEKTLKSSQRFFYAIDMKGHEPVAESCSFLCKREIVDAESELPVQMLTSTYIAEEGRLRDVCISGGGAKVVTFAQLLKYKIFPFAEIISKFLEIGRDGMGCQVEIEFSVNIASDNKNAEFHFLQIRPMVAGEERAEVRVTDEEKKRAVCLSGCVLGHGKKEGFSDIIFVKPEAFSTVNTVKIAREIGAINAKLQQQNDKYILIGPGRWGSADHLLGIPVRWQDISEVAGMVELRNDNLSVDPSQGTHFFQNITSLGIPYLTIDEKSDSEDSIDWQRIEAFDCIEETEYVKHVRSTGTLVVKVDGHRSSGVIF